MQRAALIMVLQLNYRGVLNKTRDITMKGQRLYNAHDCKTIYAVRAPLWKIKNMHSMSDAVCHSPEPPQPFQVWDLFEFWRQFLPHLKVLLLTFQQIAYRAVFSEGGPDQGQALLRVQAAKEESLPLGSYSLAVSMVLKVSVADKLCTGLCLNLIGKSQNGPRGI